MIIIFIKIEFSDLVNAWFMIRNIKFRNLIVFALWQGVTFHEALFALLNIEDEDNFQIQEIGFQSVADEDDA